ncbi:hypothetical protein QCM80_30210 [Bradyrhizobium sp. SSUT112]|uniref:hypothetical protein n=1 Tax=Bradyrhizobium sp. SSUT112 TaxID=3040604 RepID=UPI0024486334|nr:hypothetical protein [Bradyrhizobium sp. SSUT112]MDH2354910.1 hypothetical protein [Bradyrhizobium sp. SSUT112]
MERTNLADVTALARFASHGVSVNGLIIPGRAIERTLARHALNLVVNNSDEAFKVSLVGSATAVCRSGREILLTTQHQLRGIEPSQVAMLTDSGSHIITSGGCRGFPPHPETDAHDVLAFDFTEPCKDRPELKKHFFDLSSVPPDVVLGDTDVVAMLLSGFPADDQNYDIYERNHLGLARRQVVCQPESQPSDNALLTVRVLRPLSKHPDGMSGGSAFVIRLEHGKPHAYFAGIIVRGGTHSFTILRATVVCAFLDTVFRSA